MTYNNIDKRFQGVLLNSHIKALTEIMLVLMETCFKGLFFLPVTLFIIGRLSNLMQWRNDIVYISFAVCIILLIWDMVNSIVRKTLS